MFSFLRKLSQPFTRSNSGYITIIYPPGEDPIVVHNSLSGSVEGSSYAVESKSLEKEHSLENSCLVYEGDSGRSSIKSQDLSEEDDLLEPFSETAQLADNLQIYTYDEDGIFEHQQYITQSSTFCIDINPATGLSMMDSCFDVAGNIYGFDS